MKIPSELGKKMTMSTELKIQVKIQEKQIKLQAQQLELLQEQIDMWREQARNTITQLERVCDVIKDQKKELDTHRHALNSIMESDERRRKYVDDELFHLQATKLDR